MLAHFFLLHACHAFTPPFSFVSIFILFSFLSI